MHVRQNQIVSLQSSSSLVHRHSAIHTSRHSLEVYYTFERLMTHAAMQIVLRIAFRCVLHCNGSDWMPRMRSPLVPWPIPRAQRTCLHNLRKCT